MHQIDGTFQEKILKKIAELPNYKLQELLDFIDFLRSRKEENEDPILRVAGCLSGSALTAPEIEKDLYGNVQANA